jgi:hypothetical protein
MHFEIPNGDLTKARLNGSRIMTDDGYCVYFDMWGGAREPRKLTPEQVERIDKQLDEILARLEMM